MRREIAIRLVPVYPGSDPLAVCPETEVLALTLLPILRGPAGPPGSGVSVSIDSTAATALGGHRLVRINASNEAGYATNTALDHCWQVVGMTAGAAASGAPVVVNLAGEVEEPSWSWTPGLPIFLGVDGQPTQVYPQSPALFALVVAVAVTATKVVMGIKQPIIYV